MVYQGLYSLWNVWRERVVPWWGVGGDDSILILGGWVCGWAGMWLKGTCERGPGCGDEDGVRTDTRCWVLRKSVLGKLW